MILPSLGPSDSAGCWSALRLCGDTPFSAWKVTPRLRVPRWEILVTGIPALLAAASSGSETE